MNLERLKTFWIKNKIEGLLKERNLRKALDLSIKYKLLEYEIKTYEKYKSEINWIPSGAEQRLEKFGELKKAFEFSRIKRNKEILNQIKHDLISNNSNEIAEKIFPNSGKFFWKELYFAKENNDFSKIKEKVIEYNLLEIDNPSWDYVYSSYTKN